MSSATLMVFSHCQCPAILTKLEAMGTKQGFNMMTTLAVARLPVVQLTLLDKIILNFVKFVSQGNNACLDGKSSSLIF